MDPESTEDLPETPRLRVLAAGSLRAPFDAIAALWRAQTALPVAVSYDNARELAGRIEAGEPADVFASASPEHPAALHARGFLDEPRPFARNRLVVAVRSESNARDAGILAQPGSRVVIEVRGIPLGDYTRTLLERLDATLGRGFAHAAMRNLVGQEHTVGAVIERLYNGEADAAVLYSTDVKATGGRLRAIEVPPAATVSGTYVIAPVRSTGQLDGARAWLGLVDAEAGRKVLCAAGFRLLVRPEAGLAAEREDRR